MPLVQPRLDLAARQSLQEGRNLASQCQDILPYDAVVCGYPLPVDLDRYELSSHLCRLQFGDIGLGFCLSGLFILKIACLFAFGLQLLSESADVPQQAGLGVVLPVADLWHTFLYQSLDMPCRVAEFCGQRLSSDNIACILFSCHEYSPKCDTDMALKTGYNSPPPRPPSPAISLSPGRTRPFF